MAFGCFKPAVVLEGIYARFLELKGGAGGPGVLFSLRSAGGTCGDEGASFGGVGFRQPSGARWCTDVAAVWVFAGLHGAQGGD